jgi:WD40 repeat protein
MTLWADKSDLLSAHFDPTGARVATTSSDNAIQVWDTASGQRLAELQGHKTSSDTTIGSGISFIGFSQDGTRVVSIGSDETVRVWDATSGKPLTMFDVLLYYGASVSQDGTRVIAQGRDGLNWIWELDTGELLQMVEARLAQLEISQ